METTNGAPQGAPQQRSNSLLLALVVLLLISNVVLLYLFLQEGKRGDEQQQHVEQVTEQKDAVTKMLEDMLVQYDTLETENSQLRTEMDAQREKIESLLADVKKGKTDLFKARKEAETLRKIMKGYVAPIDSLNQANQALQAQNVGLTQELGEVTGQKKALEARTQEQEELISKGSVLHTTSITSGALFLRNNGKQVETNRANKAEMIKSCFTLGENRVTRSGTKTLYMRIISPDGQVLPATDADNRFKYNGIEGEFSAKRDVDYRNEPLDVCMFWTANDKLKSGQYKVEVYEAGAMVSNASFDLK